MASCDDRSDTDPASDTAERRDDSAAAPRKEAGGNRSNSGKDHEENPGKEH